MKGFGDDMIQTTYTYYKDEYLGNLVQESEFPRLVKRAEVYVSARTFGNADGITDDSPYADKLRDCLCSVAETIKSHTGDDGTQHGEITSENVGGSWSRSYKASRGNEGTLDDIIYKQISLNLANTGMLYGGAFV